MSELDERAEVGRPWVGLVPMIDNANHIAWAADAVEVFQKQCGTGDDSLPALAALAQDQKNPVAPAVKREGVGDDALCKLEFETKFNQWSTEAYATQSARGLSGGNGLSSFTLRE